MDRPSKKSPARLAAEDRALDNLDWMRKHDPVGFASMMTLLGVLCAQSKARKIRTTDDPRVAEILAAFDTAVTSPANDKSLVAMFVDDVIGFPWTGWANDAMRAVLISHLLAAPEADVVDMIEPTRRWLDWHAKFLLETEYESTTGGSCHSAEFEVWKAARAKAAPAATPRRKKLLDARGAA